jgi:predicted kinase
MKKQKKLTVLCGIPGSGKTFYVQNSKSSYDVVLSMDAIRGELCEGNISDQSRNAEVAQLFLSRLNDALSNDNVTNIVVDNTNYNRKNRKPILELVKKFPECMVTAIVFQTPHEVSRERNSSRDRTVPEFVLDRMIRGFEPPTEDEGFHIIHHRYSLVYNK